MSKRRSILAVVFASVLFLMAGCAGSAADSDEETATEGSGQKTTDDWTEIVLKQDDITISGEGASADQNIVFIKKAGQYRLSGSLTEGQIYIEAGKNDEVTLALSDVTLENSAGNTIHVENADQVTLVLEEGTENTIVSGKKVTIDENAEPDAESAEGAAIYSHDDLNVEGSGKLTVSGYINNGIHSTNDLVISSGTIQVTAVNNGIKGKDSVTVTGGDISVLSGGDGIQSSDGFVRISGGEFQISSEDDGIHGETEILLEGGMISVLKSYEGIEGNQITIRDGDISIQASDDGLNAFGGSNNMGMGSQKTTEEMPNLTIEGGTISINAEGDGIDSNGNIYMEGGTVIVNGPTSGANGAIDSGSENGGVCLINGGTILALGDSGMAEGFEESSRQCSFLCNLSSKYEAGTKITITDAQGTVLLEHEAVKAGNSIVFSCPELRQGETYTLTVGETETFISLDSVAAMIGEMSGGRGGGMRREMPDGESDGGFRQMPKEGDGSTPPEMPEGGAGGTPPEMPGGGNRGRKPEITDGNSGNTGPDI